MNLLVTAANAAPAGPSAPPPPPPPPSPRQGAPLPEASAIQAQLDAEIAQARADAAEAQAQAAAAAGQAQVIAGDGKVTVGPNGVTIEREGKSVAIVTQSPRQQISASQDGGDWPIIILPIAIVALVLMFRAFQHWTAVRAGYPIRWGRRTVEQGSGPETARGLSLLSGENEKLRQQVARLEERVAVLERIATDPARRLGAEIDALR